MTRNKAPAVQTSEKRSGARTITGLPTGIGGIVGITPMGPANKGVRVNSLSQYERVFGGPSPETFMYEAAQGFFENGGSDLFVSRVIANDGTNTAASATITDGTTAALTATAVGPGVRYNGLRVIIERENVILAVAGTALAAEVSAAAVPFVELTPAAAARVQRGDTIVIANGSDSIRFVVGDKTGNRVIPASATTATAALTTTGSLLRLETFSVQVTENDVTIYGPKGGLRMSSLSDRDYCIGVLNEEDVEQKVVFGIGAAAATNTNDNRPTAGSYPLSGGVAASAGFTDADYIGNTSNLRGLHAFEPFKEIRGIAVPGFPGTANAVAKATIDYALRREKAVGIAPIAVDPSVSSLVTARNTQIGGHSFGVMYDQWGVIISPRTGRRTKVPLDGHILGVWARTDREARVAQAPAGHTYGRLVGVLDVGVRRTDADADALVDANINLIERIDGVGVCLMGARTLEKNSDYEGLNVRRTLIYLRESVEFGAGPELFESNDAAGRAQLARIIEQFLRTEWKENRNLVGETEAEAFVVICDESNNTRETERALRKRASAFVNIPDTTERIEIEFGRS